MRTKQITCAVLCAAISLVTVSCIGDGEDTIILQEGDGNDVVIGSSADLVPEASPLAEGATIVVATSESKTVSCLNYILSIPYGAVPTTSTGNNGHVAFSISHAQELPAPLPQGVTMIEGTNIKIEPFNFIFNSPLAMQIPTFGNDPSTLALLHYNPYNNSWDVIPFSAINSNETVNVSIVELGYFVMVKYDQVQATGGIYIEKQQLEDGYFYYLTLVPSSGNTSQNVKRISFTSKDHDLYMANIPLGEYLAVVSRELRSSLTDEVTETTYAQSPLTVNVQNTLTPGRGDYSTYTGWTTISLSDVHWISGRPDVWGATTTTYGTGKFQATLTWINSEGNCTDYDLHLYGPNNLHVYYSSKRNGAFELDRDWTSPLGNAIENIYSIQDEFAPGTYYIKVHHYSGVTSKTFNCRIIMDGVVVKSVSSSISTNGTFEDIYSFNIQ